MKIISIILACLIVSCYSQKKAAQQFGKAAATYPEIPANYCSITYPPKTTFIKGDTIIRTDTLELTDVVIKSDTVRTLDTVRITKTITLPATVITKTIHSTDTVTIENTAQLRVCELERGKTLDMLATSNQQLTASQKRAKTRGIVMWSLIGLVVILGTWKLYGMFKPKV